MNARSITIGEHCNSTGNAEIVASSWARRQLKFASGRHLTAARVLAGLTQTELAKAAGLHRNAISYWERKTTIQRSPVLERIELALKKNGVSIQREPIISIALDVHREDLSAVSGE